MGVSGRFAMCGYVVPVSCDSRPLTTFTQSVVRLGYCFGPGDESLTMRNPGVPPLCSEWSVMSSQVHCDSLAGRHGISRHVVSSGCKAFRSVEVFADRTKRSARWREAQARARGRSHPQWIVVIKFFRNSGVFKLFFSASMFVGVLV